MRIMWETSQRIPGRHKPTYPNLQRRVSTENWDTEYSICGCGFTRQKYAGFAPKNLSHSFYLDFQGWIRVISIIACYFKRRCSGEIGTSVFFDPRLRLSVFFVADPGVNR